MLFLKIRRSIDDEAFIVNGKKDFESYDLKYIENQIRYLRRKQIESDIVPSYPFGIRGDFPCF